MCLYIYPNINNHTLALDTEGNIWSWGNNSSGRLGDGTTTDSLTPKKLQIDNVKFKEISTINTGVYALDEENSLWDWGGGTGVLYGDGSTGRSLVPKKIF